MANNPVYQYAERVRRGQQGETKDRVPGNQDTGTGYRRRLRIWDCGLKGIVYRRGPKKGEPAWGKSRSICSRSLSFIDLEQFSIRVENWLRSIADCGSERLDHENERARNPTKNTKLNPPAESAKERDSKVFGSHLTVAPFVIPSVSEEYQREMQQPLHQEIVQ